MTEIVTVGEKGQIVIPKKIRDYLDIHAGTKLLVREQEAGIVIKPVILDEKHWLMLASEMSLAKTWDNKYDERWDNVL